MGRDKITLLKTENDYNFWKITAPGVKAVFWNITPVGHAPPAGGYRDQGYIEMIKHQNF